MNWLRDALRRWLKVPAVLTYVPSDPGAEVVAATTYQDHIYIFTKRGQIYQLYYDSTNGPLVRLLMELPR